jgi:hypothetical protein
MPNAQRRLHIVFEDRPEEAVRVDRAWLLGLSADEAFDRGCQAGMLFDRKVLAMWIVDRTAGDEVRRVYGRPPREIQSRYDAFLGQAE